jgi:hypothetical protein
METLIALFIKTNYFYMNCAGPTQKLIAEYLIANKQRFPKLTSATINVGAYALELSKLKP